MSLLHQLNLLLSEPPGNILYHLLTLFALQAILGMSLSQWRQDREDRTAWRTIIAASLILLGQVVELALGLAWQNVPQVAATVLPPLAQAVHTATAVLLVWSLVPLAAQLPRLGAAILLIIMLLLGVMTVSFIQNWQPLVGTGALYRSTIQATVWAAIQIGVLALGLVGLLSQAALRRTLSPILLGIFLLAHVASIRWIPDGVPAETDIAWWIRLGYLVVFPLWAVQVYRRSLAPAVEMERGATASLTAQTVGRTLTAAGNVLQSLDLEPMLQQAVNAAAELTVAAFVGVAIADEQHPQQLQLVSNRGPGQESRAARWNLNLDNWPALRLAREQAGAVELRPNGLGARQLHLLYTELGMEPLGAMLVEPLMREDAWLGHLLLALPAEAEMWTDRDRLPLAAVSDYLVRVIELVRQHQRRLEAVSQEPAFSAAESVDSGRLIALQEAHDRLQEELESALNRARAAESRAAEARKQAQDLAATLAEMERVNQSERLVELEAEIGALRESLIDAEEAMAMAAAGESELSTEWVMLTITRYSSQLEEAQAHIETLERELRQRDQEQGNELLTGLAQELRTPMTSIGGYTDLLLGETIGILGAKQREFLQRIKANAERMGTLMDQIVQLTVPVKEETAPQEEKSAALDEVIDSAVHAVITQVREKQLRLDLDLEPGLPQLPVKPGTLHQVMVHLLDNACRATRKSGRVAVTAHTKTVRTSNGHDEVLNFVHITVRDSGRGIRVEDRAHVFDPHYQAQHPLIDGLGDTGAGLAVARSLAVASGGRMWVDGEPDQGSTFSVLFPLTRAEEVSQAPQAGQNGAHQSR